MEDVPVFKVSPRPSLLKPQALADHEAGSVPAPPPMEHRPRNASSENVEAKLEAMEVLARQAEQRNVENGRAHRDKTKRASVINKLDVEVGVILPPPPEEPRPASADQYNYISEVALRSQLEIGDRGPIAEHDDDDDVIFPLPKHTFEAVMERHTREARSLDVLTADRIATQMEDVIFSNNSVKRAVGWLPQAGDIVVASPPRCGQSLVVLMVRLLCAEDEIAFNDILAAPNRTAPWIECSLVDDDPRVLERKQPGTNRIFRTTMTHSMLSVKMSKSPETKFISVFRNPLDLRIAWFDHLKNFFAEHQHTITPDRSVKDWSAYFETQYTPDDIANTPLTMVQNTFHSRDHQSEYEYNVRDWVDPDGEKQNCLLLFLEEMLSSPERVLSKVAKFIGRDSLEQSVYDRILEETTGAKILEISRRNSQLLTPDQEALIRLKFGADVESKEKEVKPAAPVNKRLEFLQQLESFKTEISQRGIFTEISRKLDNKAIRRTELTATLLLGHQKDLSTKAIELLRQRWADVFGSRGETYEALYESVVGAPYPALTSTVNTRKNPVEERGPRRTLLGRVVRKSGEDTTSSMPSTKDSGEQSESNEPTTEIFAQTTAARRTLKMRIFGTKN